MPIGINNATAVTMDNITQMTNITQFGEFLVNVNWMVYGGWLYFILLWVLWVILFKAAQANSDQMLNNAMYAGVIVSIVSLLLRGVNFAVMGVTRGLITDKQLWVFPLVTIMLAGYIWATKEGG